MIHPEGVRSSVSLLQGRRDVRGSFSVGMSTKAVCEALIDARNPMPSPSDLAMQPFPARASVRTQSNVH